MSFAAYAGPASVALHSPRSRACRFPLSLFTFDANSWHCVPALSAQVLVNHRHIFRSSHACRITAYEDAALAALSSMGLTAAYRRGDPLPPSVPSFLASVLPLPSLQEERACLAANPLRWLQAINTVPTVGRGRQVRCRAAACWVPRDCDCDCLRGALSGRPSPSCTLDSLTQSSFPPALKGLHAHSTHVCTPHRWLVVMAAVIRTRTYHEVGVGRSKQGARRAAAQKILALAPPAAS